MPTCPPPITEEASAFYVEAMNILESAGIPFLVGGAFAFTAYSDVRRETKDFDIFVLPDDVGRALKACEDAGYQTQLPFPHWLGKIHDGELFIDLIFSSGNGVARVDRLWFDHAVESRIFDCAVRLCPAEEMIWSKAYVQERERFDGADIHHLFRALGPRLDWPRLLMRFGDHWRVLLGHIISFGFVYADSRDNVPTWVLSELLQRLRAETTEADNRVCWGTLLSREQYLVDLAEHGYEDGRVSPHGNMTEGETAIWTEAIEKKE